MSTAIRASYSPVQEGMNRYDGILAYWIIVFAVIEGLTVGLTSIWFAIGSLAAMIAAGFNLSLPFQIVIFFVVSAVALFFTRPLAKKYLTPVKSRTNADRVIGKNGIVTEKDRQSGCDRQGFGGRRNMDRPFRGKRADR